MIKENMKLWKAVEETDPEFTKAVSFGRKFTSIGAQSQIKAATEQFGPFGYGWGVRNEQYIDKKRDPNDHHNDLLVYIAELWFVYNEKESSFPIAADIDVWEYVKSRETWQLVDDSYKKVRTDALTKGLSYLGFNADVFLGKFDDNKYVQSVKNKFKEKKEDEAREEEESELADTSELLTQQLIAFGVDENQIKSVQSKLNAAQFLGVCNKFKAALTLQQKLMDQQGKMKKPQIEAAMAKIKELCGQEAFNLEFSSQNKITKITGDQFAELKALIG